jgi:excisionase family DNA binding protein
MRSLTTIHSRHTPRMRPAAALLRRARGVGVGADVGIYLIDAKEAARRLGIPHTWLLAQARARRIPHHRLGHYVRFNPDDLKRWLAENKVSPATSRRDF